MVYVLLIVLYTRITLCNYKNGRRTSFSLAGASVLAERLEVFFMSRRTKVKGRRIIAIIFVFISFSPNRFYLILLSYPRPIEVVDLYNANIRQLARDHYGQKSLRV